MYIWVIVALLFVIGVKYYTSREMAQLERRLNTVKAGLHTTKQEYDAVQVTQMEAKQDEGEMEDRITHMKEIIQDINVRLTQTDTEPESPMMSIQNMMDNQ